MLTSSTQKDLPTESRIKYCLWFISTWLTYFHPKFLSYNVSILNIKDKKEIKKGNRIPRRESDLVLLLFSNTTSPTQSHVSGHGKSVSFRSPTSAGNEEPLVTRCKWFLFTSRQPTVPIPTTRIRDGLRVYLEPVWCSRLNEEGIEIHTQCHKWSTGWSPVLTGDDGCGLQWEVL